MGMYPLSLLESRVAAQGMELCIDSRKATPGCVFVALPGSSADGSQFIADAVARGAGYVVCRPESAGNCGEAEVVDCADPRQALGLLARARYGTASLPVPRGRRDRDQRQDHHDLSARSSVRLRGEEDRRARYGFLSLAGAS